MPLHLVKLCVGAEAVEDLVQWQAERAARIPDWVPCHVTRMWPKREAEVLNGGSLYWVFKGVMQARQRILSLQEVEGEDGIRRCALILDPMLVRVAAVPRRPFQGWRYLAAGDAPPDLPQDRETEPSLPAEIARALADMGLR